MCAVVIMIKLCLVIGTLVLNLVATDGINFSLAVELPTSTNPDSDNYSSHELQQFCLSLKQSDRYFSSLICSCDGSSLAFSNCITYDNETHSVSYSICPNIQSSNYTLTSTRRRILLPQNFNQLNDYMCSPMNRKGTACSECANGFGPSFTSLWYNCVSCQDTWYRVPLFICLEFVPITIFYFIILVFQISLATAPMPCFIMYAQFIIASLDLCVLSGSASLKDVLFAHDGNLRLDVKIIATIYGVFNLDFFQLLMPPLCINSKMKLIHIFSFGYISAFYPIFLISLTWISVELHGHNFRPLVWLWRPFHKCFVSLRRSWNTKNDIIDVFITFLLLSYNKCLYQTVLLLLNQRVLNYTESGKLINVHHQIAVDVTVAYGSKDHLIVLLPALIVSITFNIAPPILLILHGCKIFNSCLSRCRLNCFVVNIFVDKLQGCYRDGLEEGRDMRSFSSLYFILRMAICLIACIGRNIQSRSSYQSFAGVWVSASTVLFIVALFIALIKPYKVAYMSYLDTFLLSNLALILYLFATSVPYMLHVTRILLLSPIVGLLLIIFYNKFNIKSTCLKLKKVLTPKQFSSSAITQNAISDVEKQPLIQPVGNTLGN